MRVTDPADVGLLDFGLCHFLRSSTALLWPFLKDLEGGRGPVLQSNRRA